LERVKQFRRNHSSRDHALYSTSPTAWRESGIPSKRTALPPAGVVTSGYYVQGVPATAKNSPKPKDKAHDNERLVAQNRRARHEYEIIDTLECGIALVGSEVKSLRNGKLSLEEAYGRMRAGEVWLMGCDIPEYVQANRFNHEPKRPRKLLMHRREIEKFAKRAYEQGLTLVPLKLYFKEGRAKVLMGLGRGRKLHDKREKLKKDTSKRDIQRAMRRER
jgi:SsrA-binding protein